MNKLYFISIAILALSVLNVQAQENIILGGNMEADAASSWSISNLSNDPTSVTSYEFGYTDVIPAGGEGGGLHITATNAAAGGSHLMFYQQVTLVGGNEYIFDFSVIALQSMMNSWFEVYLGTTEPIDGEDYGSGQKALGGFKSSNWASQCEDLFEGTLQEIGCLEGSQGSFVVEGEGEQTFYIGFKVGIWEYDTTIEFVVDNVSLVQVGGETNVTTLSKSNDIKIFPNPAISLINIQSNLDYDAIRVLNLKGQEKICIDNTNGNVDVSVLPKGIFVVELMKNNKAVAKSQFIKQ